MEASLPYDEQSRLAALNSYEILDTLPEQSYDDITRLASTICGAPIALISLIDESRQWFKSRVGLDIRETSRDLSFCAHALLHPEEMLVVPDAKQDIRFADNPLVQQDPHIRFYAGAPLATSEGHALGTLCVIDHRPRDLTRVQEESLRALARQVMAQLELHRKIIELEHVTTQYEQAKQQRRENELLVHKLLDSFPSGAILVLNKDLRYVFAAGRGLQTVGLSPQTMVGASLDDLFSREDAAYVKSFYDRVLAGEDVQFDLLFRGHDYIIQATPLRDQSGEINALVAVAHDITERKQNEEAQRISKERFEIVSRATNDAIWDWDMQSGKVWWSEGVESLFGYKREEVQESSDAWKSRIHPDELTRVVKGIESVLQDDQYSWSDEYRFLKADGTYATVHDRGFIIRREDGEALRMIGSMQDITARKEAEAALHESMVRFRQLADTVPQMVWVTRPDGFHEYYNQRWYEFTGVPEGSTDGEGWNQMFHPDDQERAWAHWRHSLATGEPYEVEYRLKHHSGTYRWTLGRALPVRNGEGEIERWFGTCTDIDEFKTLQEKNRELLESERAARLTAERESRLKDEFLSTLSHELRTPLNAIIGWAQMMGRFNFSEEENRKGAQVIERNALAQSQLIEDLLDMSRIVSGNVRLDVHPVNLADVIEAACATVETAAAAKSIEVHKELELVYEQIAGDAARLQQVVWNLLSNAVKFTPNEGSVVIALKASEAHQEIRITDSGQGIEPEFLPYVFDRFRQADSSSTRRYSGLGLGLSIVKSLVELHGGTVAVESAGAKQGTTFVVTLPVRFAEESGAIPESEPLVEVERVEDLGVIKEQLKGLQVLAVDDSADNLDLARRVMEECGACVATATSVDEAMELFATQQWDVLVSDIGMPDKDGNELIRWVRGLPAEEGGATPAIALTAYAHAQDRQRALEAGYDAYITKPMQPESFLAALASLAKIESTVEP